MKKRILSVIVTLCLVLAVFAVPVLATEVTEATEPTNVPREPGCCGESITWSLQDGVLNITGIGEMDDFPEGAPWADRKDEVAGLVISDGITYVGSYAFRDMDKLESVVFGEDVYEIGKEAFCSCEALTEIDLPASFKIFGEGSFMACPGLKEIRCAGRFPSFRLNCLWDTYATIYFPAERPWAVEYIRQLEEAFHGRIEFLASDGTDPYIPTEATEPPAATEAATVPPTTVPPTTAPTEPSETVTQPPATTAPPETEVPTQAPTQKPAEPAATTEPADTEAAGEEERKINWIPLALIGIPGGFLLLGGLIFRMSQRRGRYSKKRRRR